MENGFDGRSLAEKFSELAVGAAPTEQSNSHSSNSHSNNNDSNLFQVLKAVEAAEATIKQQVQRIFLSSLSFSISQHHTGCYSSVNFITKFSIYSLHYKISNSIISSTVFFSP